MITPKQLRTLQTLWGVYAQHSVEGDSRAARLAWAGAQIGREVASFTELHGPEAALLIDTLKRAVGQEVTPPRRPRERAMARGSHGRRGRAVKVQMMAAPRDLAEVDELRERVGMTREGFEGWLRSRSSPIGARPDARLLTVADCNRVRWALSAMLRRADVAKVS